MMRNTYKRLPLVGSFLLSTAFMAPVFSEAGQPLLEKNKFSIGAGLSSNSVNGSSDEIGFQFFGAYDLSQINLMEDIDSSVEFGFMDYGFARDSTGIWGTYVVSGQFTRQLGWLARLGLDIGDDSGLMIGVGGNFNINSQMDARVEFVVRDEINSLQFNFLYGL